MIYVIAHQAILDSVFVLAVLDVHQRAKFIAKAEYFRTDTLFHRLQRWFVGVSAIPVDRLDRESGRQAINALVQAIERRESVAVHAEGTRAPDRRVYKGKLGALRVAHATGAPIIPVGLRGTRDVNPPERKLPRLGKVEVHFGEPMYFTEPRHRVQHANEHQMRQVMERVADLSDMPYLDISVAEYLKRLS